MPWWALRLTFLSAVVGIIIAFLNELFPIEWHIRAFQWGGNLLWQSKIRRATNLLYAYNENSNEWLEERDILFLEYTKQAPQPRRWNTTRWPFPQTPPSLISLEPELLSDDYSLYYALKLFKDTVRLVALLPIWIRPSPLSIHEAWEFPIWGNASWIRSLCLSPQAQGYPILLVDQAGQPLLKLHMRCYENLRLPLRWIYLSFIGIALIGGLIHLRSYLAKRYRHADLIFLGVLFLVWQLLHWTALPGRLLNSAFFSPESYAISPFHTSLWDLAWSIGILFFATTLLENFSSPPHWVYPIGYWLVWGIFGVGIYLIARHSQVEIDPLQQPSLGQIVSWAIVLAALRRAFFWLHLQPLPTLWLLIPTAVGAFLGLNALGLAWWSSAALTTLYLYPLTNGRLPKYVGYIITFLLLVVAVDGWITWGQERRARFIIQAYALQEARLRDPNVEYRMAQILPRLSSDTALWQSLSVEDNLIDAKFIGKLIRRYFFSLGDAYEVVVSCWKAEGGRADNLFELRPLNWKQAVSRAIPIPLSPYLYFITQGTPRYFYVARVPVSLPDLPPLEVQIELYPRTQPLSSRIKASAESPSIEYALYENSQLIRWWGYSRFPSILPSQAKASAIWRKTDSYYEYISSVSQTLTIYLRLPARDLATHLATIPIFLTLLLLGVAIDRYSAIRTLFQALYQRDAPFIQRFQALFGVLLSLPLLAILSITFLLFLRINEKQRKQELIQKLNTVSSYLAGEAIILEKLAHWLENYLAGEESFVRDLMRRIGLLSHSEAFIYTSEGALYSSTLPVAYWNDLVAPFIDAHILAQMKQAGSGPLVEVDAQRARLMGYAPLRTETGRLIGILHIPQPIPPNQLYEPLRYFIAYTVNAYLLLSLVSIVLGLLLMERFSAGLQRVVNQLRLAPEAPDPPLLKWEGGKDEIATLVSAYNEMVERLRASQRQLEKTLRRVSQQEMAFQAAHEIKTALTPLKLHLQHLQRVPSMDPEKLREIATRLLQRIEALVRIANTFMNFAKLGSAEELTLQPINLNSFLEEQLHPFMQNPNIAFHLELPPQPLWIEGNTDALQQILNNLLQNAIQALEGAVNPRIRLTLYQEGNEALLAIQDNGPGIPPEVQERIFEFYFTTRRTGTGLGLAITKGLVERMGGRISFTSEVGKGTTFYLAFPLKSMKNAT
ncbi:MAG: HAMP domain-containing histidine kinase [Bacteroidia bacterium]|nr:HAMP domain-containing histidine kinase [Bacteroidia bacterium]